MIDFDEMDYEKAYKEALERAKSLCVLPTDKGILEFIFPELAESDDEKIRKEILEYFNQYKDEGLRGVDITPWIAYLEKQKEQPADAKSERVIKAARRVLNNWLDGTDCPDVSGDFAELEYAIREYDGEEKQKPNIEICPHSIKSKSYSEQKSAEIAPNQFDGITYGMQGYSTDKPAEWSEDDEKMVGRLRSVIRECASYNCALDVNGDYCEGDYAKLYDWLKSLPKEWKPSEEQIEEWDCSPQWHECFPVLQLIDEAPDLSPIDSKELDEAAKKYRFFDFGTPDEIAQCAFKAGANWQKEQLRDLCYQCEKNGETIYYKGMAYAVEQMKKEAIERTVKEDAGGYPYIDKTELYDYEKDEPTAKKGDKVRVYIFKDNKE